MVQFKSYDDIPKRVLDAIITPHEHEDLKVHPPLWLIWVNDGWSTTWRLKEVSNSERSAKNGYIAAMSGMDDRVQAHVERIPANHGFASSIQDEIDRVMVRGIRQRGGHPHYKHEGD